MKQFIKYVLATMVGLCLTFGVFIVLGVITLIGVVAASENSNTIVADNSILQINVSGTIDERSTENPISAFIGEQYQGVALDETLDALKMAGKDDNIKGVYLYCGALSAIPAMAEELRQAIVDFKKSGKWVIAYADTYSKMSYYIASPANQILLNPDGGLDFNGLASEPIFFKDVLDKLGIKMQVFRVGAYKSAVEPFTSTEMSPANREQITSYLTSIWGNMVNDVAASRKLTAENVNGMADSLLFITAPEVSVKNGLVDKLCYIDEVKSILKAKVGLKDAGDKLNIVSIGDYLNSGGGASDGLVTDDDQIAVYYAYGNIVDVASTESMAEDEPEIVGSEMIADLQDLRNDDNVKAVVIRVNSPGGSAYASEQIWREISLLKAKKPVIISMGGMAASGGYYISCGATRIFAEPMTITGSIGIFGMVPDMSNLMTQKIGLKFGIVKTNEMSDFGYNLSRPFNATEAGKMQAAINRGYELFTGRVAKGRKMPIEKVKAIAQGRVWTGEQALKNGLVDELGSLNAAVAFAAKQAKLKDYSTVAYPAQEDYFLQFFNLKKAGYLDSQLKETLGEYYTPYMLMKRIKSSTPMQARLPYEVNIK